MIFLRIVALLRIATSMRPAVVMPPDSKASATDLIVLRPSASVPPTSAGRRADRGRLAQCGHRFGEPVEQRRTVRVITALDLGGDAAQLGTGAHDVGAAPVGGGDGGEQADGGVSPGSRADAATMSRIFDSAVWNCTVSLSRFSVMTSPPRSVRSWCPRRRREAVPTTPRTGCWAPPVR